MNSCFHKFRRYFIELGTAFLIYTGLIFASNIIESVWSPTGAFRVIVALLPMPGALAALWAIMRAVRRLDELARRIQFEALAFSFAGTALITFAWGFAETAGVPRLSYFFVWPLMGVLWVVGFVLSNIRYR